MKAKSPTIKDVFDVRRRQDRVRSVFQRRAQGVLVLFCDDTLEFGKAATGERRWARRPTTVKRAAASQFKGKSGTALDILAPAGLKVDRLVVAGTGKRGGVQGRKDFIKLGGKLAGQVGCGQCRGGDDRRRIAEGRDAARTTSPHRSRPASGCAPTASTATRPRRRTRICRSRRPSPLPWPMWRRRRRRSCRPML